MLGLRVICITAPLSVSLQLRIVSRMLLPSPCAVHYFCTLCFPTFSMQKQETIALHELGDQSSPDPASRLPCGLTIVAERFRKFWLGGCTEITLWTFLSKACITGCCSFHLCVLFILQIGLRCLLHKAELPFSCRNVLPPVCCGPSLVSAILCAQKPFDFRIQCL